MSEVVSALGTSPERSNLLVGLIKYRELLGSFGYIHGVQFVDGSFVEDVETRESRSPGDIDVFSFLIRAAAIPREHAGLANHWFPSVDERDRQFRLKQTTLQYRHVRDSR
jgi:hypothetical protein